MHTKTQHHIGRDARHLKQARQHWEQGLGHAKRQEWRQAVVAFEKAMAGNPDDNLYRINLARALFKQGEPGKAVEHMQRAVQREPDNVLAREFLSECLCAQGRYAEASDAMLHGMGGAHTPSASYLQSLGNILFSAQRYKESIQVLMEALISNEVEALTREDCRHELALVLAYEKMKLSAAAQAAILAEFDQLPERLGRHGGIDRQRLRGDAEPGDRDEVVGCGGRGGRWNRASSSEARAIRQRPAAMSNTFVI